MNEDKIAELRSKLRNAMQTGAAEASNCCRELIAALKAEDLSTWEPELCLLLLEMPHLRPEQIPEKVEKLYFDLSYLRAELPSLSASADEGSPETVRRLGFNGPYAAFQEIFRWIDQFAESKTVALEYLEYARSRLRQGFYFGNLDPFRMPSNAEFRSGFVPERIWFRFDPCDSQDGEAEYIDAPVPPRNIHTEHTALKIELF